MVLGTPIKEMDLRSVWFSEEQQFIFLSKPEYISSWCLTVSSSSRKLAWRTRKKNVSRVLTAQTVRVKPEDPTQVLPWQWVLKTTAGAARSPGPLLGRWGC